MFYKDKIDKIMNAARLKTKPQEDEEEAWDSEKDGKIRASDVLALFLSALIVFGPIFIVMIIILILVY